ncbi:hypothetical protein MRB53_036219 [Persea americana]|uniref:Uncharacterized protein n=1 Tax=Persea americana TaxID=3435 RepID=A0ACC2K780_PERAE|nr:hypothetical protein MRB53_036219 [Persea americana]
MNAWAVAVVSVSSFVLFSMCIGELYILLKLKKLARRSSNCWSCSCTTNYQKICCQFLFFSSSTATLRPVSLTSTIATCKLSIKTFTLTELEKATDCFGSDKILGEGGFGRVYHGTMEDGSESAIKLLIREDQSGDHEFIVEVEMLSQLHHCNLVKLIGICIEDHTCCLVYELVSNGSVETHLLPVRH